MASSGTKRYRSRGTPSLGQLRIDCVAMVLLKAKKACSLISFHRNDSVFLSNL